MGSGSQRVRTLLRALVPEGVAALRFRRRLARQGVAVTVESGRQVRRTTFGRRCRIRTPIHLYDVELGDRSYVEAYTRVSNTRVGRFSAIGPGCHIGLAEHPSTSYVSTHPLFYRHDPGRGFDFTGVDQRDELPRTEIGSDVWIGAAVCVKAGVVIGDGAVVGAGAVVTADVPPYAVCAGVPARVLRYRFDDDTIAWLLAVRWWDRDEDWLRRHHRAFHDIEELRRVLAAGDTPSRPAGAPGRVTG